MEISAIHGPGSPLARTGDPEIDRVLQPLDELAILPLTEHIETFETVYGELQNHLARAEDT